MMDLLCDSEHDAALRIVRLSNVLQPDPVRRAA